MLEWTIYFSLYWLAGFSLKIGDEMLDTLHRARMSLIPLSLAGLTFGVLMSTSQWDLVLLCAIIIGVVVSGKMNRVQFIVGPVVIGIVLLIFGLPEITDAYVLVFILVALLLAAAADEMGNDWADKKREAGILVRFFRYRFGLKLCVLVIAIGVPSFLPAALGLWLLDVGYEIAAATMNRSSQHAQRPDYSIHQ